MKLARIEYGSPTEQPPLLIVHGLFGSGRNWGAIARRLSEDRLVVSVDHRNHGDSPRASSQNYPDMASDIAGVIAEYGGRMDVLGHSMGGKTAMWLALTQGALINRLIVADIAPVAYPHSQSHLIHAMRGMDLSGLVGRSAADARLAETLNAPQLRAFLLQSLDLKAEPPRWKLNLDVLEAEMGSMVGWPADLSATRPFTGPCLFITGAESDYVKPEDHRLIESLFPAVVFEEIAGAGHWLHAEQPRPFEAAVAAFLA